MRKYKAGCKLPSKLIAVAEKSFQKHWITPKNTGNKRTSKILHKCHQMSGQAVKEPTMRAETSKEIGRDRQARLHGDDWKNFLTCSEPLQIVGDVGKRKYPQ